MVKEDGVPVEMGEQSQPKSASLIVDTNLDNAEEVDKGTQGIVEEGVLQEDESELDRSARADKFKLEQKKLKKLRELQTEQNNEKRLVEIDKIMTGGRANRLVEKPWLDVFDSFVSRRLEARLDELAIFRAQLRDMQINAERELKQMEQIGFKKDRQIMDLVERLEKCHECLLAERKEGDTSIKAVRSQSLSLLWGAKRFTASEVRLVEYSPYLDPDKNLPIKIGKPKAASTSEHLDPQHYREEYRPPNFLKFIERTSSNQSLFQRAPISAPGDKKLLFIGNGLDRISGAAKIARNWNDEYQSLLPHVHHPNLSSRCHAVTELQMLEDDFQKICNDISCTLVNDHFLPPEHRSVKPVGLIRARMKNLGDQEIEIAEQMFAQEKKTKIDGMTAEEAKILLAKEQLTAQEILHGEDFVKEHPVTKIDDFLAADIQVEADLWEMIYSKDGIFFFMFGMLGDDRYGTEFAALKLVSREIQASQYILQNEAYRQGIFLPMSCVTEWRGSRVLAIAELPPRLIRKSKTGRMFEVASLSAGQRLFVGFMKSIGFLSHRMVIDGKSEQMVGGCDTQLLQGDDFRFYCLNVGVCLPQFPKQPWSDDHSHAYEKIRPELLKRCVQNLNSDAFSLLAGHNLDEVNCAMKGIHNDVMKNLIPAIAMLADSAANSGVLSMETLPKMLHSKGINMRYLGLIWSQLKNKTARKILLSEMAARVIKQRLRNLWRASQNLGALSVHAHFVQTHQYIKEVFCDWKTVEWNEINKDLIKKYFYTFDLPTTVSAWQERILQDRVCSYVCDRCGIQLAEGAIDSVLLQKSKFAFLLADIRAIIPVASIPQIILPQLAAALQQLKQSIDASRESDRTGFAEEACSLVSSVPHFDLYQAESMCIQGEAYFNWAHTLSLMHARQALQHAENCFHHALTMQPQWWFPEFRVSQTMCSQVDRSRLASTKFRLLERCGFWFLKAVSHCLYTEKTNEFAFVYHCLKKEFERMKDEILRTPEDYAELRDFSKLKELAATDNDLHADVSPNTISVYAWVLCLTPRTVGLLLHAGFLNTPLRALDFTMEPNIPNPEWQHIAFWGQLDRLTSLALPKSKTLTSTCLLMLFECIPKLKSLDISACNSVGNGWLVNCGTRATNLRQLKAENTDWWCYDAFNALSSLRSLRLISLIASKDLSGPDASRIARFLPRLRTINLANCAVRKSLNPSICISFLYLLIFLQGVDQVTVKEIVSNCTELVDLNLSNLENIGRVAFQVFHFLSNLQTLDLSNNRNVDHNDMEKIGKLTKMVTLLLKNCTRVSLLPRMSDPFNFASLSSKCSLKRATAG